MLSLGSLSSASGAANYFIKGGNEVVGYFAGSQAASEWGGTAKAHFKLKDGPVDLEAFEALLDGRVSDTQTLGRMVKGERLRDPGRDFTFSAPKSVSLAAIGVLEKPIIEAFTRSVKTAMDYYETHFAQAKIWDKKLGKQVKTGGQLILFAHFLDFVSRANDPQLHMHTPVINLAIGQDGKIRSLNFDLAYKHKILLGNIQRAELAKELKALGLTIRPAGKNGLWELEGPTPEVLKTFSKRREHMVRTAPHRTQDAKSMALLAKVTRPNKTNISPAVQKTKWTQELAQLGTSIAGFTKSLTHGDKQAHEAPSAADAVSYAISHMSETEHQFDRYVLLRHAMVAASGNIDIKTMESELQSRVDKGQLLISEDERWFKPMAAVRLEQQLLTDLDKGHLKARVITPKAFAAEEGRLKGLTPGQQKAAELVLTDLHRFVGVDGVAGTGKTYSLRQPLTVLKAKGYEIIGLAPTGKAVENLTEKQIFDKTLTVQMFHKNPIGNSNTVLVVDEAGMVGSKIFREIMHYANSKNMPRVIFMGDPEQLPPIEAGRPFEHLIKNGLRSVRMEDVFRQASTRHRKGVVELSRHELIAAFKTFEKEIHEIPKQDQLKEALKLRGKMDDPMIIVNTNAERRAINTAISEQNRDASGQKQRIWDPFYMTKAEKTRVGNYEGATHIRFKRNVGRDFKAGEIYRITGIDHQRAQLQLKNIGGGSGEKRFTPARHGSGDSFTDVYKQAEINLRPGDTVKFRQADKKLGISNNDFGRIVSLSQSAVNIAIDDKVSDVSACVSDLGLG